MGQSIADALDAVQATGQQAALLFGLVRHCEITPFLYFVRSKVPWERDKGHKARRLYQIFTIRSRFVHNHSPEIVCIFLFVFICFYSVFTCILQKDIFIVFSLVRRQ